MQAGDNLPFVAPVIGLLGQYSSRNLGDAAIIHEIVRNLRARCPQATFVGICSRPDDTARTHGIAAFPISGHGSAFLPDGSAWAYAEPAPSHYLWRLLPATGGGTRRIDAVVRSLSLLLMAGGGQIDDYWGGAAAQPRFLATWTLLAKLRRVPTAFFCVGLDQLSTRSGRWLALSALGRADFVSFRDARTQELLQAMGLRNTGRVDADPAFGLTYTSQKLAEASRRILVSPICQRSWPGATADQYARYLRELTQYCELLIRAGLTVRFACSQISMDPDAVVAVSSALAPALRGSWSIAMVETFEEFMQEARAADLVITSRLHGAILSLVAGTTVVAVSVARKVDTLMSDVGLEGYCLAAATFEANQLLTLSHQALAARCALERRLRQDIDGIAGRLPAAFDAVAAVLAPRTAR